MSDGGPGGSQVKVLVLWKPQAYGREQETGQCGAKSRWASIL